MENQTVVVKGGAEVPNLVSLRKAVADAVVRQYGAERKYAQALNLTFGSFDWFAVEANDTTDSSKPVHVEKKALFDVLKAAKHSNPSTVWARIRKLAREERYPVVKGEGGEGGEGEGEGQGAGSRNRGPLLRNVEDLSALYSFNKRQTELPEKVKAAQVHLVAALKALGVDIALIK